MIYRKGEVPWLYETCDICKRENIIGYQLDNNIWDKIVGNFNIKLCLYCLDKIACQKGIYYLDSFKDKLYYTSRLGYLTFTPSNKSFKEYYFLSSDGNFFDDDDDVPCIIYEGVDLNNNHSFKDKDMCYIEDKELII